MKSEYASYFLAFFPKVVRLSRMDLESKRIVRPIRMVIKYVRCLVVQDMRSPHTINHYRYTYVVQTLPIPGMETHPLVDVNYFASVNTKMITI